MTKHSYEECRKVMQQIRIMLMEISKANGEVAKWSNIEMSARENMNEGQATGAYKMGLKALEKLDKLKAKFAAMSFPDSNLKEPVEVTRCKVCNGIARRGKSYCGECAETLGSNDY